jgi:hypothetical protein
VSASLPLPWAGRPPELAISVEDAGPLAHAAAPTLRFALRVERRSGGAVRSLALMAQVRLAVTRRAYDAATQARLVELFGTPDRWGDTLRSVLWTNASVQVPAFADEARVELCVPCTYDLDVAASKYLNALEDGAVPLELLFSGSVFYAGDDGRLQVAQLPWELEASFALPAASWRETMDGHFPHSAWLRLDRDLHERLLAYRAARTLPSWDAALRDLLDRAEG